jgi:hypothetical protein
MLTTYQQRQLQHIEEELRRSDRRLARSLTAHALSRPPMRQRLAVICQRILAAWMRAAGQIYYPWPGHRWP